MVTKAVVHTDQAPKAVGPYSQAIILDSLIFCSGQIGLEPETGMLVKGGVEAQTRRILLNIKAILEKAGSSLDKIVKSTIFLTNMNDFSVVNSIYASFFSDPLPARSCIEVSKLPKEALVEIEVIAHL